MASSTLVCNSSAAEQGRLLEHRHGRIDQRQRDLLDLGQIFRNHDEVKEARDRQIGGIEQMAVRVGDLSDGRALAAEIGTDIAYLSRNPFR